MRTRDPGEWRGFVRQYHALGIWHATRYLAGVRTTRDPWATAQDVVQSAWLALWRRGEFTKGLFVVAVLGFASNAARADRPIDVRRTPGKRRTTSTFPVQVFGQRIEEVTFAEDIRGPTCGEHE